MLHRSFKAAKCKTSLKLAVSRIKLLRNKKSAQVLQLKRELAKLLESGQERTARIRVEHVVREEKTIEAYNLIEIYCELVAARLPVIESQKNCPIDLKEAIASIIFASPRCADIPELLEIRKHFTRKYGKEFVSSAVELLPNCGVSRMVVEKLSTVAPDGQTKIKILSAIAEEHNINWDHTLLEKTDLNAPNDILNGPNTLDQASKMHAETSFNQASSHDHTDDLLHSVPSQKAKSSSNPDNIVSTDMDSNKNTSPPRSGLGPGISHASSMENWNMEFSDATTAAQAAAESAERASMAARAAAELSSRLRPSRQYSREGKMPSNGAASFNSSSAVSTKIEKGNFSDEVKRKIQISRSEVDYEVKLKDVDRVAEDHSEGSNDKGLNFNSTRDDNDMKSDFIVGPEQKDLQTSTKHSNAADNVGVVFDDFASDEEEFSANTTSWSPTESFTSQSQLPAESYSTKVVNPVSEDFLPMKFDDSDGEMELGGPRSADPGHGSSGVGRAESMEDFGSDDISTTRSPVGPTSNFSDGLPEETRHEQKDGVSPDMELSFGILTGGLRNKGYRHPPYIKLPENDSHTELLVASSPPGKVYTDYESGHKVDSVVQVAYLDSDSDSKEEVPQQRFIKKQESYSQRMSMKGKEKEEKVSLRAPVTYFDSDGTESEEDLRKEEASGLAQKGRLGGGLSRRTKGSPSLSGSARKPSSNSIVSPKKQYEESRSSKTLSDETSDAETQSSKTFSHVHPMLPDYDTLSARLDAFRLNRKCSIGGIYHYKFTQESCI